MTFFEAQQRLLDELRMLVQNGLLTERGMAHLTGVSQPHIHNVLKGVRKLSPEIADRALNILNLSLLDLAASGAAHELPPIPAILRELPLLRTPVGLHHEWRNECTAHQTIVLPIPVQQNKQPLVAVCLEFDASMMIGPFAHWNLAVVDRCHQNDAPVDVASLYVVQTSVGTAVRYVRPGTVHRYLAAVDTLDNPAGWEIAGEATRICARLVWIGNEQQSQRTPHCKRDWLRATASKVKHGQPADGIIRA